MAELLFLKGNRQAIRFPLPRGDVSIGRQSECSITLEGTEVSRVHAVIHYDGGYYLIEDKSKNGTWINSRKIQKSRLTHQDTIRIGEWQLQFIEDKKPEHKETVTVTAMDHKASLDKDKGRLGNMLGQSKQMKSLFELIQRVAPTPATVLILGETGTGKELIANLLHQLSKRSLHPFVPINCASISPNLVESELFGHEKGAFTGAADRHPGAFEQAAGGTLFLDEVGELSRDVQSKLLRVLETSKIRRVGGREEIPVHCRVIAATHRNLAEEVKQGRFREDLYYRLFVMPIETPPLRHRQEEVPLLTEHFLKEMQPDEPPRITKEAEKKLTEHLWPGNVRELKNVILRAALLATEGKIEDRHVVFLPHQAEPFSTPPETMECMEKEMILAKLKETNWNKTAAARKLGMATSTIFKKIKEYNLKQG